MDSSKARREFMKAPMAIAAMGGSGILPQKVSAFIGNPECQVKGSWSYYGRDVCTNAAVELSPEYRLEDIIFCKHACTNCCICAGTCFKGAIGLSTIFRTVC